MSLIFAVDSDKRQSAVLASLLRSHVDADLVQSASATEGLAILQGRIPDLILTSSLLSPRDEAALASHLRELGDTAAHVHTLTIPVIAAPQAPPKKKPQGVLGGLRREKDVRSTGCDPAVFAREVALYLERAVERRATTSDGPRVHVAYITPVVVVEPEPVDTTAPDVEAVAAPPSAVASVAQSAEILPMAAVEPPTASAQSIEPPTASARAIEPPTFGTEDAFETALPLEQVLRREALRDQAPVRAAADEQLPAAFVPDAAEIAGLSAADLAALTAPRRIGRAPDAIRAPEPPMPVVDIGLCEDLNAIEGRFAAHPATVPSVVAPVGPETAPTVEIEAQAGLSTEAGEGARLDPAGWFDAPATAWPWMDDQDAAPLEDVLLKACGPRPAPPVEAVVPPPPPEPEPAPTLDFEALELIGAAALQAGLDALGTFAPTAVAAPEPAAAAVPPQEESVEPAQVFRRTRERSVRAPRKPPVQKAPRPAQDEWGMFDPAQCGSAALFDEDDWEDEAEPPRPATRPRGVVY